MNPTKYFRISLNLSHYYSDHRHRARIFVCGSMNTIEDLHTRISAIFNITNFYLTSSLNEYLPPSEDVRILQNDETIWVIPSKADQTCYGTLSHLQHGEAKGESVNEISSQIKCNDNILHLATIETCANYENLKTKRKKKKRKYDKRENASGSSQGGIKNCAEPMECSVVVSPIKKKRLSVEDSIILEVEHIIPKKKKKKQLDLDEENTSINQSHEEDNMYLEQEAFIPKKKKKKQTKSNDPKAHQKSEDSQSHNVKLINSKKTCGNEKVEIYGQSIDNMKSEGKNPFVFLDSLFANSSKPPKAISNRDVMYVNSEILCKGDLSNYKKQVNVQSNTEEYLKEKRINIVKIEVVGKGKVKKDLLDTGDSEIELTNPLGASEQHPKRVMPQAVISENYNKRSLMEETTPVKSAADTSELQEGPEKIISQNGNEILSIDDRIPKASVADSIELQTDSEIMKSNASLQQIIKQLKANRPKPSQIFQTPERFKVNGCSIGDNTCHNNNGELEICATENVNSGFSTISTKKELIGGDSTTNAHDEPTKCNEIKHPNLEGGNKNENLESVHANPISSGDGCLENVDCEETNPQKVQENCIITPTHPELISTSSLKGCPSEIENSNFKSLSDNSKYGQSRRVSSLGDRFTKLFDNANTESSRSSSITELDDDASRLQTFDGHIVSNVTYRNKEHSAFVSNFDSDKFDDDDNQHCRKRRRVRRRKKKSDKPSIDDLPIVPVNTPPVSNPFNSKSNPRTHIKFVENLDDSSLMIVDVTTNRNKTISDTQTIIVESDTEEIDIKIENIMKSPLMDSILPKGGDIISFKILKMSENYNPEVSPYITAKVKSFNKESKMTTLEIINGLAHFETPAGRLHIVLDEDKVLSNIREVSWTDMIEPRLLFP